MHIDVVSEINQIGQIAVLTEELREGKERTRCRRIGLIWRSKDDHYVTASVWVEGIGSVDISQLFLLGDCRQNLLVPGQVRLTHNVHRGRMKEWADFYERLFNFREVRYFDIEGQVTGVKSKA